MTQRNHLTGKIFSASIWKPMLVGAGIGLLLISLFLIDAGEPDPSWGKLWRIKPLIIVPLAGAGAGVFYFLMASLRQQNGWKKIVAYTICFLAFFIALWLGTVLGLNGTYWD